MSIQFDMSEVRELIGDFSQVPQEMARIAKPIVAEGANNIKNQLRDEMEGRLTPVSTAVGDQIARTISYDLTDGGFAAEIGPRKEGAGNLANIAYFGGAFGGGGTVPDPRGALEAEAPKFMDALADAAAEVLR